MPRLNIILLGLGAGTCQTALAQLDLSWYTIDCGGQVSLAGSLSVTGSIGQPDAATSSAGALHLLGGYWGVPVQGCYANCDASTLTPVLNVNDFTCFLNRYAAGCE